MRRGQGRDLCRPPHLAIVLGLLGLFLAGCAAHEPGRYQVKDISFRGQKDLAEVPLEQCLVSRARPKFELKLGLKSATCGEPPFDSQAPRLNLWHWWWADWPAFNHAVFDKDLERIERWYRARGYYDAKVVDVEYDPPAAADPSMEPSCNLEEEVCPVRITVTVEEGQPTLIDSIDWEGIEHLDPKLQADLQNEGKLASGEPIDEAEYEAAKERMYEVLRKEGFAQPSVEGTVKIDTDAHEARVVYRIEPGPLFTFGTASVEGNGSLPEEPILAAAACEDGRAYTPMLVQEMQAEVYALGAFTSVQVHEEIDEERRKVDVRIEVTPHSPHALRVGVGLLSGARMRTSTGDLQDVPQWDTHLFARYEKRHVFGTLGRLSIEERPRMIFSDQFPRPTQPRFGNIVKLRMNQPGLIEPRTDLFSENAWDMGPDPFLRFWRSDVYFRVGAKRGFFVRKLLTTLAVQQDLFIVGQGANNQTSDGSELPSSYGYTFFEQDLKLDFRDNRFRPIRGVYFGLNVTESFRWQGSDWTAFRVAPEVRTYVPLFFDVVWASRFSIAGLFIRDATPQLDATSQRLGPSTYRLRGGGANSNRGFLAGRLGVGLQGGIRRWEASTELRFPLGSNFALASFADVGDVNDQPQWRFQHLNLAVGGGLRFYTIIGAIRLDFGLRVPSLQRADGSDGIEPDANELFGAPGALHLTIGDPF